MRSYFAKLAARATRANLPASSGAAAAAPPPDPFEQTSLSHGTGSVVAQSGPAGADSVEAGSRGRASPPTQPISRKSERPDSMPPGPERSTTLPSQPQPESSPTRPPNDVRFEQLQPRHAVPLPAQTEPTVVAPPTRNILESETANTEAIADKDERLAASARAQALMLLHKSDVFMESLLGRREAPTKRQGVDKARKPSPETQVDEPQVSSKREEPGEERQPRLQPSPPPHRKPEPDDRSSLVIGNLTVEVVPLPPAPPVTPRREVVIVRSSPTGRSAVPSSRRFGLGVF